MSWKTLIFVGALAPLCLAADAPLRQDDAAPAVNPGIERVNAAVVFYVSFEHGADADMALGDAKCIAGEKLPRFAEGRFGRALLLGSGAGNLKYQGKANLDFQHPGAFSFWIAPKRWIRREESSFRPLLRFITIPGRKRGSFIVQRQGFKPPRDDLLWAGFAAFPEKVDHVWCADYGTLKWKDGEWHFIAVNWDRRGLELSVDGTPFRRKDLPVPMDQEYLFAQEEESIFSLGYARASGGGEDGEETLLDEFVIYRRPLSNEEVNDIYAAK